MQSGDADCGRGGQGFWVYEQGVVVRVTENFFRFAYDRFSPHCPDDDGYAPQHPYFLPDGRYVVFVPERRLICLLLPFCSGTAAPNSAVSRQVPLT